VKVIKLETFLTNAGLRNYLFVKLTTDTGITGIGEASLEWQEKTVETLIHEWVEDRILGANPLDFEKVISQMIRDQYQGGSTIMTAISGIEIAMWDIVGKACGQPIYQLLGGQAREELPAYANGWYGGAITPEQFYESAKDVVQRGYKGLKFDPFGTAWKTLDKQQMDSAEKMVEAVRDSVGSDVQIMIEVHGRLGVSSAIEMGRRLEKYDLEWYEEPVVPNSLEQLKQVKESLPFKIAAGERLYTLEDLARLCKMRAADVIQMDLAHCGGLYITRKVAAIAEAEDIQLAPHCSIGPVALCAAIHFDWSTPQVLAQENFAEYDVPWRNAFVYGWNPIDKGRFQLPDKPGLGIDLDIEECKKHPYKKNAFPSLWDESWFEDFTQKDKKE
jgi:galactonate dehydratase